MGLLPKGLAMSLKPIVVDRHDVAFIKLAYSGISLFAVGHDGLDMAHWGDPENTGYYLRLDDVIAWHEREIAGGGGSHELLEMLQTVRHKLDTGNVIETVVP